MLIFYMLFSTPYAKSKSDAVCSASKTYKMKVEVRVSYNDKMKLVISEVPQNDIWSCSSD